MEWEGHSMPELARFGPGSNTFRRVGACRDSRRSAPANLRAANGPPIEAASHPVEPLHNRQANIDIAAGGVGIGAYLVRLLSSASASARGTPGREMSSWMSRPK